MKLPPSNCPACNSQQNFPILNEITPDRVRKFIRCTMCKTETTLSDRTREEERLYLRQRNEQIGRIRRSRRS